MHNYNTLSISRDFFNKVNVLTEDNILRVFFEGIFETHDGF